MRKTAIFWQVIGLFAALLFPWYILQGSFFSFGWVGGIFSDPKSASAIAQGIFYQKWWLITALIPLFCTALSLLLIKNNRLLAKFLVLISIAGLVLIFAQGFIVSRTGARIFTDLFVGGAGETGQIGFGAGAFIVLISQLFILTTGFSGLSKGRGDAFIIGLIGLIVSLVGIFVFFPVSHILIQAFQGADGGFGLVEFWGNFSSNRIWGIRCLYGAGSCGTAWNSLFLAIMTGAGTTLLGLAFALIATRTNFRAKRLLRVLTIIPIITPPFVIGLALILLFGRAGMATEFLYDYFDVEKTRWLYGFWGIYMAQLLSFTPIAFLVLIGVVEGVSPSMEEASQTLNGNRWQTFRFVSLPLMRPGIANAFLLGFIESIADFGNPLVLGGNYSVLSTEIYFSIVGAVANSGKAATLAIVLLCMTLGAFLVQRMWLGKKSYATVTGKGDSGQHASLNPLLRGFCYATAIPWAIFTVVIYAMIVFGSFVKLWGYDNSFTLEHYIRAFAVSFENGIHWTGVAWDSYFTTLTIASIAAPLTSIIGLAIAYLLVRQKFVGKQIFEFSTMLSFAIPGTVIGVSYILAFNVPPIELTGTSIILILVFVFRNMPVGVRGGIAAMSQLDKSLDEASITLGANSFTTVRKIIVPLIGPAILAALTYSFVRAITAVSAVIFLVSAKHNMATSFIIGRVENGEFGIAIAYSTVLIVTMLTVILLLQFIIGKRRLRKENRLQNHTKVKTVQA